MKNVIYIFLLLLMCPHFLISQEIDTTKLNNYFDTLESNDKFMGSVIVSKNGKIVYSKTVGFADVENKLKAHRNTKYRIGSISKTFTSVLILKAVEERKLTLDLTIDKYFPAVVNAKKITLLDLLTHRSGIHNFTNDTDYLTWHTTPKTEKEMVEIIAKAGSDFEPDSQSEYSNSNFVLLSYILEKTYKRSYGELLKEYITQPLKLNDTYFGDNSGSPEKECKSYTYLGTWKLESETSISIPMGAGGIVSTPKDLVKFSDALFEGKVLTKESLDVMKTIRGSYGAGLIQAPFYNKIGYGHTGAIDGFSSIMFYFPDGKVSYALISNGTNYNNNDISIAVLSAVYNQPYEIPKTISISLDSKDLDRYLGVYSSTQLPMKITISKDKDTLLAQATGQSSFPLEPTGKDKFEFTRAGIILEFTPEDKTMLLKQGGGQFLFSKE